MLPLTEIFFSMEYIWCCKYKMQIIILTFWFNEEIICDSLDKKRDYLTRT